MQPALFNSVDIYQHGFFGALLWTGKQSHFILFLFLSNFPFNTFKAYQDGTCL